MNDEHQNEYSQIISHINTKRCTKKLLKNLTKNFLFSVKQVRIKFKRLWINLQKTASGLKEFLQNKGLGHWCIQIYQFVSSRDSC